MPDCFWGAGLSLSGLKPFNDGADDERGQRALGVKRRAVFA